MEFNAGTRPFTSLYAPCVRVCARRAEVVCGSLVATLPLVTLLLVECLHAPRACFLWICVLCVLCVTVWCSVWQCVSVCCSVLHCRHVSTCDCIVGRMTACMSMSTCPTNTQTQALYIERENKSFIWDMTHSCQVCMPHEHTNSGTAYRGSVAAIQRKESVSCVWVRACATTLSPTYPQKSPGKKSPTYPQKNPVKRALHMLQKDEL